MNLENIENLIERENITLIDTYLENALGSYVNYDKLNLILYNSKNIQNSIELKQVLAEELRTLLHGCHLPRFYHR